MKARSKVATLQDAFASGGIGEVFIAHLGWEAPTSAVPPIQIEEDFYEPKLVASLKGFRVYRIDCEGRPSRQLMRQVDVALAELSPERMEVFTSPDAWFWHWPRRTNAGTTTFESVEISPNTLPTFLAQRLTGLEFTIGDHRQGLTLADVRARVQGHFDASNVTTKFYERFRTEHVTLASTITGLPSDKCAAYATTLLNRLMFLYFMQKKEFLNGDSRYLENTLVAIQQLHGRDQYHSFYRDALLPLFFEKLNSREGTVEDPEIAQVLGDVPYVNGGVFGRNDLERVHADTLAVPDSAFERILGFFAEFNWHLDTRPTGNQNEINPEVIGYIFEQYINFTASGKKENGAYYTPHDVTAFMVAQTVVPRILDDFVAPAEIFELVREDPDRYIQPAMLYGWNSQSRSWNEAPEDLSDCWAQDPSGWTTLDAAKRDPDILLPGETWVEAFHRRQRVEWLRQRAHAGDIRTVNDLITENLNGQLLLTDAIDRLNSGPQLAELFDRLTGLSVFDPTCGSGAFLFAALEVLEDIYDHIVDGARALGSADPSLKNLLQQLQEHTSKRYFIRKHVAIRNLYGTDIMPGAIETAKLRIFLSLAACLDTREELQPLPDLDFNLKVGNLVVGFKDANDVSRVGADLMTSVRLDALQPKIDEYADLYASFADTTESDRAGSEAIKVQLRQYEADLREECNSIYAEVSRIAPARIREWVGVSRPFHWFCEFPDIIRRGGFDVVIGNPPYVRMSQLSDYGVVGYATNDCPDLYAVCYERSLSLTSALGRHAFIVMASLTVWDAFAAMRGVISGRSGAEWWSTFGKIPAPLFRGVRVRNTIVILGPGEGVNTTRHHIHTAAQRDWLFPTIEYASSSRSGQEWPIRGGVATSILEKLRGLRTVGAATSRATVYLRPTASYWFPVLLGPAPVLGADGTLLESVDSRLRRVLLLETEREQEVIAMLGSRLTYLWWAAIGDDFDVYIRETDAPRALAQAARDKPGWDAAVATVLEEGKRAAYVSLNKKWYFNVRWNNVRSTTDVLDRLALEALGGSQIDWRNLHILYRQVMRSSGDSAKGRYVTANELVQVLRW